MSYQPRTKLALFYWNRWFSSAMCTNNSHHRLHQYLPFIHINMYPPVNYITCWLVAWNIFIFYWEYHHPNWRTHIFQRGRSTTNQHGYCIGDPFMFDIPNGPKLKIVIFRSLIYQRGTSIYQYLPFIHIMFSIFISHCYQIFIYIYQFIMFATIICTSTFTSILTIICAVCYLHQMLHQY